MYNVCVKIPQQQPEQVFRKTSAALGSVKQNHMLEILSLLYSNTCTLSIRLTHS